MKIKTFVDFSLPGVFMPEHSVHEVESRDVDNLAIPKSAFAFKFYDVKYFDDDGDTLSSGQLNVSPRHYVNARKMTLENVMSEYPDAKILHSNMRCNDWDVVVLCRTGNFQPFGEGDVLLELESPTE